MHSKTCTNCTKARAEFKDGECSLQLTHCAWRILASAGALLNVSICVVSAGRDEVERALRGVYVAANFPACSTAKRVHQVPLSRHVDLVRFATALAVALALGACVSDPGTSGGNAAPSATIAQPATNATFKGGDSIPYAGAATDDEDGLNRGHGSPGG
jgi:hypothetical protein